MNSQPASTHENTVNELLLNTILNRKWGFECFKGSQMWLYHKPALPHFIQYSAWSRNRWESKSWKLRLMQSQPEPEMKETVVLFGKLYYQARCLFRMGLSVPVPYNLLKCSFFLSPWRKLIQERLSGPCSVFAYTQWALSLFNQGEDMLKREVSYSVPKNCSSLLKKFHTDLCCFRKFLELNMC